MMWERAVAWLSGEDDRVEGHAGGADSDADAPAGSGTRAGTGDGSASGESDAGEGAEAAGSERRVADPTTTGVSSVVRTDGSGTPQWTGDAPISFQVDDGDATESVVRPEDVVDDPIDFDDADADALLDAVDVDDGVAPSSGADGRTEDLDASGDGPPGEQPPVATGIADEDLETGAPVEDLDSADADEDLDDERGADEPPDEFGHDEFAENGPGSADLGQPEAEDPSNGELGSGTAGPRESIDVPAEGASSVASSAHVEGTVEWGPTPADPSGPDTGDGPDAGDAPDVGDGPNTADGADGGSEAVLDARPDVSTGVQATGVQVDPDDEAPAEADDSVGSNADEPPASDSAETAESAQTAILDSLQERVDRVETRQEQVTGAVEALEAEMEGLHDQLHGVRGDLETLVDLVRETAPTRGGAASAGAPDDGTGLGTTQSLGDVAAPPDGAPAASTDGASTASTDGSPAASTDGASTASTDGTTPLSRAASGTPSPDPAGEPEFQSVDSAGETGVGADVGRVDPRSEAAAERLRTLGDDFGGEDDRTEGTRVEVPRTEDVRGEATVRTDSRTPSDVGDFRFQKVVLPVGDDGDDGEPAIVGEDLETPYLGALPDGYAAEEAVIEWLDGLVAASDEPTALAALAYYESVGWLAGSAREALARYLLDVDAVDSPSAPAGPPDGLDPEDHQRSHEYVARLASGEVTADGL